VGEWPIGPFVLPAPDLATIDLAAATIAIAAAVALIRYHQNMIAVLVAAALAGMIWTLA
jgi:chromate transporter